jgi:hypothetical protein
MPDDAKRGSNALTKTTVSGAPSDSTTTTGKPSADFDSATHAYHHTLDVSGGGAHRVDLLVGTPVAPPAQIRMPFAGAPREPEVSRVIHEVGSPVKTSFKLGFGFTAGAWSFRVIVQVLIIGALIVLGLRLLSALMG